MEATQRGSTAPPTNIPDLTHRVEPAYLPELMDDPCPYPQFRDCVRDLGSVNRWTLAYGPTLRFLEHIVAHRPQTSPLRVLDVGSGGGDSLRRIARWATRRNIDVQLTGIDLNPHAARAARELSAPDPRAAKIVWLTGDVFAHPAAQSCDIVLSSLVTHHLPHAEIVRFLRWQESTAREGWFINDLLRRPRSLSFFRVFARAMRWHPFVQHDGPVSIRRAFREPDWHGLLAEAAIPLAQVKLNRCAPGRLCLARQKETDPNLAANSARSASYG